LEQKICAAVFVRKRPLSKEPPMAMPHRLNTAKEEQRWVIGVGIVAIALFAGLFALMWHGPAAKTMAVLAPPPQTDALPRTLADFITLEPVSTVGQSQR
jgi:hypothetical protein